MSDFPRKGEHSPTFTKAVLGNTIEWDDVVIPDGEFWVVWGAEGAGLDTDGSNVAVVWDSDGANPETLFLMYGAGSSPIDRILEGDGVKKLSIRLRNRTLLSGIDLLCRYYAERWVPSV